MRPAPKSRWKRGSPESASAAMRQGANRLALPCSPTSAPPAKLIGPTIGGRQRGPARNRLLCAGERRCCPDRLAFCATRSLPGLRSPEEVMSMKTAQAKFALLVEILWRPERIRLLVD